MARIPQGPWDFPGNSTGVSCHFLLQGIFLDLRVNPWLPLGRWEKILYHQATNLIGYYLVKYSSTSYISAAFTLAFGHPGLEIKVLYYCTLHSTV